jgi:cytochrome c
MFIAAVALLAAGRVVAQEQTGAADAAPPTGDAVAGEEHFQSQCIACHVVENEAGEVLAGRNSRVGPNLYGAVGRVPGGLEDYDYSELMEAYGAMEDVVWEEANTVGYLLDPTGFLREATGEDSGRSKMAYQVRDEQEARDLYAYLATFSSEAVAGDPAAAEVTGGEAASE